MRHDDEFNIIKITNEKESFSHEFGHTPIEETASYRDNRNAFRDELNDNSASNDDRKPEKEKKRQEDNKEEQVKELTEEVVESSSSSSAPGISSDSASAVGRTIAGGASAGSTVAGVVGASIIAVSTLSAVAGLNVFLKTTCTMKELKPSSNEVAYVLELVEKNDDDFFISLRNDKIEYYSEQGLMEGVNEGVFEDLIPSTSYIISVFDVNYKNNPIYEDTVSTLEESTEGVYISFDANGGTGTMETVHLTSLEEGYYAVPECGFTAPSGMTFNFWVLTIADYGTFGLYPGTHIENFRNQQTVFVAHWRQASPDNPVSVHLNPGDAGGDEIIEVRGRGEEYAMPETPFTPPTDMKFAYWVDDMADTTELRKLNPYEIITLEYEEEASFTAFWEETSPSTDPEYVTISFVANNGTDEVIESIQHPYNTEYTLPPCDFSDPEERMMFGGWMINDSTSPLKTATWYVNEDTVLTASWVACNLMTYYADNDTEEIYIDKVAESDSLYYTLSECPFTAPSGMECVGWLVDDDAGQTEVVLGDYISNGSDKTLHANWAELPTYHVSFDANEGFGSMEPYEADITKGQEYTLPPCDFEAPDETKTFDYWDVNGEEYHPEEEVAINEETVIVAIWKDKTSHNITYQPGEHATGDAAVVAYYQEDNPVFLLEARPEQFVVDDGYALVGWEIAGNTYDLGDEITVTEDLEAIAIWEAQETTFNGLAFYGLYDVEEKTYLALQLDYIDPSSHYSNFVLTFTEGAEFTLELEATKQIQEIEIPDGAFGSVSAVCSYYLEYEDQGATHTWGSGSSLNVNSLYCMNPDIELASFESKLIYWNDATTSYIAAKLNHRVYNNHGDAGELYLRFKQTSESDFQYVHLEDRPGSQLITLPFQLSNEMYDNLYGVQLVGSTDGENYTIYQRFTTDDTDPTEFMHIEDASAMAAHMDSVIPSDSAAATQVRLDLFGCDLTSLSATFTLQFEFTNLGSGGNVIFTLEFTPTSQDMANGYVLLDLTSLSNEMSLDYGAFVASAQVYACTVTLVNSVQSNTIVLYDQYNFSIS